MAKDIVRTGSLTPLRTSGLCPGCKREKKAYRRDLCWSCYYSPRRELGTKRSRGSYRKLSPEADAQIAADYRNGISGREIATNLGLDNSCIYAALNRQLVDVRSLSEAKRLYAINEQAFDDAENPDVQYWTGMMLTDGSVFTHGDNSSVVKLSLKKPDVEHVQRFLDFVGTDRPIYFAKPSTRGYSNGGVMCTGAVNSAHMASTLACYGVVPNKTRTARLLAFEDSPDTMRGLVDGDGWVYMKRIGNRRNPVLGFCGTREIVGQFVDFVARHTGKTLSTRPQLNIWVTEANGRHAQQVARLLYENATVALPRKLLAAQDCMAWVPKKNDRSGLTDEKLDGLRQQFPSWKAVAEHLGMSQFAIASLRYHRRLKSPRPS